MDAACHERESLIPRTEVPARLGISNLANVLSRAVTYCSPEVSDETTHPCGASSRRGNVIPASLLEWLWTAAWTEWIEREWFLPMSEERHLRKQSP